MTKLLFFSLFLVSGVLFSQNIGINSTGALPNNSAMLDVSSPNKGVLFPNVNLLNTTDAVTIPTPATGLMVWNTNIALPCGAGYYYNSGTPAAPVWLCFKKQQQIIQLYGTAGRLAVASTAAIVQPGLSTTFVVPAGQSPTVVVVGDIGINNVLTTSSAYSIVDVMIYVDGAVLLPGGWNRSETLNGTLQNAFSVVALTSSFTLTPGVHTIEIRTARFAGNTTVNIGGNCSLDTNCGEFTLFVNY